MLKHTLILPESDTRLAVELLDNAVNALDIVLMLVLGKSDREREIVHTADKLCDKTQAAEGNSRKVVWIRRLDTVSMEDALTQLLGPAPFPEVAVLNFHDEVKKKLTTNDSVTPLQLERAFLKGHQV
jgi:hypothetical protein